MQHNITPWWFTGFVQADGSFGVPHLSFSDRQIPFYPRPYFAITQSDRVRSLMLAVHQFLGVGSWSESKGCITIIVRNMSDLLNVIIPHFDAYPPRGGKYVSYIIFKYVCILKSQGLHLTLEGYIQILQLSYSMNNVRDYAHITDRLVSIYGILPNVVSLTYDHLVVPAIPWHDIQSDYIAGLIDGDGSLNFIFPGSQRRVSANFTVIQALADYSVLEDLLLYFGCGKINQLQVQAAVFKVITVSDILRIWHLIDNGQLRTVKASYLPNMREALEILDTNGVSRDEHLLKVVDLVYEMNLGGKRRKLTKEQYISRFIKG